MRLLPLDPSYPARLRDVHDPPMLTLSGPLDAARTVAIVGSRRPHGFVRDLARKLAFDLACAGVTIVSGGALGVDAAAHQGALEAGGATWVVFPCGHDRVSPPENRPLFDAIARSERGRMIWPFADDVTPCPITYRSRNKVLVGLADAVVCVQARASSGSINAMRWAQGLSRPLWVVPPGNPYDKAFDGTREYLERGARPLYDTDELFHALGLPPPPRASKRRRARSREPDRQEKSSAPARPRTRPEPVPDASWSTSEKSVFSVLSSIPQHVDQLVDKTGLATSTTVTALLTLSLKDVVVEGPDGFFRRALAG